MFIQVYLRPPGHPSPALPCRQRDPEPGAGEGDPDQGGHDDDGPTRGGYACSCRCVEYIVYVQCIHVCVIVYACLLRL